MLVLGRLPVAQGLLLPGCARPPWSWRSRGCRLVGWDTVWPCCSGFTRTASTAKSRSSMSGSRRRSGRPGFMAHWIPLRTRYGPRPRNSIMGRTKPQLRRARLVADGGGLENRYGGNLIVGSNPTPSAESRCVNRSGSKREPRSVSLDSASPVVARMLGAHRGKIHSSITLYSSTL